MTDALENRDGTVSFGDRAITSLHFADDIDGLAGEEEELAKLVERLNKASTACGIEISAEKTKLMTNNTSGESQARYNLTEPIPLQVEYVAVEFVMESFHPSGPCHTGAKTTHAPGCKQNICASQYCSDCFLYAG